jgi:integrase
MEPDRNGQKCHGSVRVKSSSKRLRLPPVLTVAEFYAILAFVWEPYRTIVLVTQCLGLRVSEIKALRWSDSISRNRRLWCSEPLYMVERMRLKPNTPTTAFHSICS